MPWSSMKDRFDPHKEKLKIVFIIITSIVMGLFDVGFDVAKVVEFFR